MRPGDQGTDPMTIAQFVVGRTYSTRSICDHECIHSVTIVSRTAKRVTFTNGASTETKARGIAIWDGVETFKPFGDYSMCAIIRAVRS